MTLRKILLVLAVVFSTGFSFFSGAMAAEEEKGKEKERDTYFGEWFDWG